MPGNGEGGSVARGIGCKGNRLQGESRGQNEKEDVSRLVRQMSSERTDSTGRRGKLECAKHTRWG
jgi:hypothetical protein